MSKKNVNNGMLLVGGAALLVGLFGFRRASVEIGKGIGLIDKSVFSDFINISEVEDSAEARAHGIQNTAPVSALANARMLAQWVLDPITLFLKDAPRINSWYRNAQLNAIVGGAAHSDHMTGAAADIENPNGSNVLILRAIFSLHLPYDQLIIYGPISNPQYIHVSIDPARDYFNQPMRILDGQYKHLDTNAVISQVL